MIYLSSMHFCCSVKLNNLILNNFIVQGTTTDGMPHVGKVPGTANQFILAGYNGGGNGLCFLSALGVARMVAHDVPFSETGVPKAFEASAERLHKAASVEQGMEDARNVKRTS